MKNYYYVYGHYDAKTHNVLYIGKGCGSRYKSAGNRSNKWHEYTKNNKWYSVILFSGLQENESLDKEGELIALIKPLLNSNKVSKQLCTETVNFSTIFYYDVSSPSGLRWKVHNGQLNHSKRNPGDVAGSYSSNKNGDSQGYKVGFDGKEYKAHRIIWKLFNPEQILLGSVIDHIDGNPENNNILNLRNVSLKINARNSKIRSDNKVGFSGIDLFYSNGIYPAYRAKYKQGEKTFSKSFAVRKFGLLPAFALACQWREDKIKELNEQGAGYTERHGT